MDFLPSFSEFSNKLKKNKNQIVYTKFSADLDTPVSLMMKLAKEEKKFIPLESVTGGEIKGRYSVIGMKPDLIWKCNLEESEINRKVLEKSNNFIKQSNPPVSELKSLIKESYLQIPDNLPAMSAGLFGYLSYEMINFEKKISEIKKNDLNLPQSILFRPSIIIIIDNIKGEIIIINPIWANHNNSLRVSSKNLYKKSIKTLNKVIKKISMPLKAYNFNFNKEDKIITKAKSNFTKKRIFEQR